MLGSRSLWSCLLVAWMMVVSWRIGGHSERLAEYRLSGGLRQHGRFSS